MVTNDGLSVFVNNKLLFCVLVFKIYALTIVVNQADFVFENN